MSSTMDTQFNFLGKTLADRYEIQDIIGEGGMAVVYKALDNRLNRFVAVKIMREEMAGSEEFRQRFCAESHAVAMLSHPNIVAVYDVSQDDSLEYIVMELIDGITLRQYMDKKGKLGWKEMLHFSRQTARALAHAHERGIIHRDIKPQNLMLLRDGTIKVADFGIAALESELESPDGQAIGSIHYISPEQLKGEMPDARCDIYSLGIMMYEMLTGTKPFTGDSIGEIAIKHISGIYAPISAYADDVPEELAEIVAKAMCAEPEDRYICAEELADDLDAFSRDYKLTAEPKIKNNPPDVSNETAKSKEEANSPVKPVHAAGEISNEKFRIRRKRARKVSYLAGSFAMLLFCLFLFVFLWRFWLSDVFSPADRIEMPNFVGNNFNIISEDEELTGIFDFDIEYIVDTSSESGTIITQNPAAGRSMMRDEDGIYVKLTVSTGTILTTVPEVSGYDYREAVLLLQNAGFLVEIENVTSDSVDKDKVISISPSAGEKISAGSTVYVTVSSGSQLVLITMPNLIGLTEDAAIKKLQKLGLSYGGTEKRSSEYEPGTVIGQSTNAFAQVEEHAKIYLVVSSGMG